MNISGTLNVFRLIKDPSLCLPQCTISTFNHLPIPLSQAFPSQDGKGTADIRAVVLDKDNCFAVPNTDEVYPEYQAKFHALRKAYPASKLLIVSNTAGSSSDADLSQAAHLQQRLGVDVLSHSVKKPGCRDEVLRYFYDRPDSGVTRPEQVAVVGDRLFTDVMMANLMGGYGVWVSEGVVGRRGIMAKAEGRLASFLLRRGYKAPDPRSGFEGV